MVYQFMGRFDSTDQEERQNHWVPSVRTAERRPAPLPGLQAGRGGAQDDEGADNEGDRGEAGEDETRGHGIVRRIET